jgi:HlyD family secretion protein
VRRVSADSFIDDKTGATYFTIEVAVAPSEISTIRQYRGADSGLKPGLPVEVVVPTRNRTAAAYLIDPLREMLWKSFRQH